MACFTNVSWWVVDGLLNFNLMPRLRIRAATRFEGGDRGQVHWTCGLGSLNRGGIQRGQE